MKTRREAGGLPWGLRVSPVRRIWLRPRGGAQLKADPGRGPGVWLASPVPILLALERLVSSTMTLQSRDMIVLSRHASGYNCLAPRASRLAPRASRLAPRASRLAPLHVWRRSPLALRSASPDRRLSSAPAAAVSRSCRRFCRRDRAYCSASPSAARLPQRRAVGGSSDCGPASHRDTPGRAPVPFLFFLPGVPAPPSMPPALLSLTRIRPLNRRTWCATKGSRS